MSEIGQKLGKVCIFCTGGAFVVMGAVTAAVLIWVAMI